MKSVDTPEVTAELVAEAAAWLAVLHGPNRSTATERNFAQWMNRSASHAQAFEEATGIWEEARNLPRTPFWRSPFRPLRFGVLKAVAATAAVALVTVGATIYIQQLAGVSTKVGEQRVLALEDGTRVILNTDTRVVVSYSAEARRVELKEGEALFEVARQPDWPFVVVAGTQRVEALGTAFVVRRDNRRLAVTLIEGKVAVSTETLDRTDAGAVTLNPGDRVVFAEAVQVKRDRPELEKVLAWQRREIALDDVALTEAVAEMNRYSRTPLEIAAPEAEEIRVTGLFRAGDSVSFARAVAEAYGLVVVESRGRILLSGR